MSKAQVTILMPVYNGEKHVKQAIESILNQTYSKFELLVINDGSTDNTQEIIDNFKDSRIRCVQQQENIGVSRSLNYGLSLINTKYTRRHDADDISLSNMLETQMQFLRDYPEIQFVSTRIAFMTDSGKVAHDFQSPNIELFRNREKHLMVKREMFNPFSPIIHGTVLGPTAIFREMNGYRNEFIAGEDIDLWLRIIEKYQFAILKQVCYFYRLNDSSATKFHKSSIRFYLDMCLKFADDRLSSHSDPIQRGEVLPKLDLKMLKRDDNLLAGRNFRADILYFEYLISINARDYNRIIKNIRISLKEGWKLKLTYIAIFSPLVGEKFIQKGVKLKKMLKDIG